MATQALSTKLAGLDDTGGEVRTRLDGRWLDGATHTTSQDLHRRVFRQKGLHKPDPNSVAYRPTDLGAETMSREQLHGDRVGHPYPEATLQLQAAEREVDDPHCLESTMAVYEGSNTGLMTLMAPPWLDIARTE